MKNHEIVKMKKVYNIGLDVRTNDNLEITRRLYRNITEISKKLEEQKSSALTVIDIFTPTAEALRSKLRDYCERLIIDDPINHIPKTEELLWKRGFYDIVSSAKKLRKDNAWNDMEIAFLSTHLSVGVGYYHHLILRLQFEYNLNLIGVIDFAYPLNQKVMSYMEKPVQSSKVHTADVKKCVTRFIHRSLIWLGDLTRYRLDFEPTWDPQIAIRYYKIAIVVDNKYGMPHNQLGTIATNKNYGLDSVYHYMRSILCTEPFEGAEGNLKRTIIAHSFNGKEKCLTQSCVARLFLLLQLWDNSSLNTDRINQESQMFLNDFENCLNIEKCENIDHTIAENQDSIEGYLSYYKNDEATSLTDDIVFKIVVISLMKIFKIQIKEPNEVHSITAFVLAVFSQLLQFVVMRLEESLIDIPFNNENCDENINNTEKTIKIEKNTIENNEKNGLKNTKKSRSKSECLNDNGKIEINGNHLSNGKIKKSRDKSKNLLRKLRRPRNRKNSSDSDGSDIEAGALESSNEDIDSDITENEEDVMSDENILSDEALSDDLTDEDKSSRQKNGNIKIEVNEQSNGYIKAEEKFIEENEDEDKNNTNNMLVNNQEKHSENTNDLSTNLKSNCNGNSTLVNNLTYAIQTEKLNLDPMKILKVLNDEKMLISIKICCDWLHGHQDIIKICAKGSKSLLKRLVTLLNIINLESEYTFKKWDKTSEIFTCLEKLKDITEVIPLPEDIDVKGLKIFENAHKNIDWEIIKIRKITSFEETLLRILKIIKFGHYLCSVQESGILYDKNKDQFTLIDQENKPIKENQVDKSLESDHPKGKLMRHMGKLWLKAEVRALESRLHHRLMSPYLVPDHEVFTKFMPLLKHLVHSKKFIVVIPSVVVSALDELKKTSSYAREATRWLESQLQQGSRFLRAQRPHEKLPLPFIKGPKSKDKGAWLYFQIIECCHYLTQQNKTDDSEIPVVTLLTGIDDKKFFTYSPDGLAKSAGVNFEHIGVFHAKWKLSIKSHG